MNGQQITRRIVIGAFALALTLPGSGAAAEDDDDGWNSGGQFKGTCEDFGGTFTDTGDGNLWCQWEDDSQTVCDEDGQDCHDIPRQQLPDSPWGPTGPTDGVGPVDGGGTEPSAPVAEPLTPVADTPTPASEQTSAVAPDNDQDQDHSTSKKGKGKKGGKHRRR